MSSCVWCRTLKSEDLPMLLVNKCEQAWNVFDKNSVEWFEMYKFVGMFTLIPLVLDSPFFQALNERLFLSLEHLERPECSSISDGYTLSIAFACLLEIVKSLDVLVQENNGSSNGGDVGWIEPEVPGTAIETGVGTDTIRAAAKESVENDNGG